LRLCLWFNGVGDRAVSVSTIAVANSSFPFVSVSHESRNGGIIPDDDASGVPPLSSQEKRE
jgi:hypothetical protein